MAVTIFTGNRSPSLTDVIKVNGVPFPLTTSTVKLRMRLPSGTTFKVDTAAVVTDAANGAVRYDWAAIDVDTPGDYVAWWSVTLPSGNIQDTPEFAVRVTDHIVPSRSYTTLAEVKSTLQMQGLTYADQDISVAIAAASRAADNATGRRFYLDTALTDRYFTPDTMWNLRIDDIADKAGLVVAIDRAGTGSFTETWAENTEFVLSPLNAPLEFWPWEWLTVRRIFGKWLPTNIDRSVKVTAKWGWPAVPQDIKIATEILAVKLLRRVREAPFGVVVMGDSAARIATNDPDLAPIWRSYSRRTLML
jgi:hypothetical protein